MKCKWEICNILYSEQDDNETTAEQWFTSIWRTRLIMTLSDAYDKKCARFYSNALKSEFYSFPGADIATELQK